MNLSVAPGPGSYNIDRKAGVNSYKYTMGAKGKVILILLLRFFCEE